MIRISGNKVKKIRIRETSNNPFEILRKVNFNGILVFSSANNVVYHVSPQEIYIEEIEYGETCLRPTTFTPQKTGWIFVGWRQDTIPSKTVLSSMLMDDEQINLYAVFKKNISLTYYGNGGTSSQYGDSWTTSTKEAFCNNENYSYPKFILENNWFSRENYRFNGWNISGRKYNAGDQIEATENLSVRAMWQLTSLIISWFEVHGVAQNGTVNKTVGTFDLSGLNTLTAVIRKQNYNGNGSGGTVGIYINGTRVIFEDRFTSSRDVEIYTSTADISDYGENSKITTVATGNNEDVLTITSLKAT